jgi:polar amino acid transport system substrate-binding protein
MTDEILAQLAPTGTLRAGINMANVLLVTERPENGDPGGVGPDFARAIADRLGVPVSYVHFPTPGEVADTVDDGVWDIGLIGAEPSRAEKIEFTAAYVEIEATYMVWDGSAFNSIDDVDKPGVRIAVSGRSAYDLYLSRTLQHAELVRAKGLPGAQALFVDEKLDALAGLRPAMNDALPDIPGAKILDGKFTAVQQAVGCKKSSAAAAKFLSDFVEESKANGLVASLIEKHGVVGRLSVAGPA